MDGVSKKLRVAFVVGGFPAVSETFIINQVADLIDRGVDVRVFTFKKGSKEIFLTVIFHIRWRADKGSGNATGYLGSLIMGNSQKNSFPLEKSNSVSPCGEYFSLWTQCAFAQNIFGLSRLGRSLTSCIVILAQLLTIFPIKEILKFKTKVIVTFYGYDVSQIVQQKGVHYYDRLKMSVTFLYHFREYEERVVALGFDP